MKPRHSIMRKLLFTMLTNSLLFLLCVGVCLVTIYNIHSDLLVVTEKGQRSVGVTDLSRMVNEKDIRIADYITFMKEEDLKEYRRLRNQLQTQTAEWIMLSSKEETKKTMETFIKNNKAIDEMFSKEIAPAVVRLDEGIYTDAREKISGLRQENNRILETIRKETSSEQAVIVKKAERFITLSQTLTVGMIIFTTILSYWIIHRTGTRMKRDIDELLAITQSVAAGNLTKNVPSTNGRDEIHLLGESISKMVQELKGLVQGIERGTGNVQGSSKKMVDLADSIKESSMGVSTSMEGLTAGSTQQAASTTDLSGHYRTFSNRMGLVAEEFNALKTLSLSIQTITGQSGLSMMKNAEQMEKVYVKIGETTNLMKELQVRMDSISRLSHFIKEVATRTDILSLNASIEAARVGELGRGFQVVAGEIRQLSHHIHESLAEMDRDIKGVRHITQNVSASLDAGFEEVSIAKTLTVQVGQDAERVTALVTGMGEGIGGISAGMKRLNEYKDEMAISVSMLSELCHTFDEGARDTHSSIQVQHNLIDTMYDQSDRVNEEVLILQRLVDRFQM
ncbi:methyl-accepting chemotaxis protein [Bacillus sp. JRC01]|nr:methyl-accepting chemotaxis protein [Bacillus sp. JRC01]